MDAVDRAPAIAMIDASTAVPVVASYLITSAAVLAALHLVCARPPRAVVELQTRPARSTHVTTSVAALTVRQGVGRAALVGAGVAIISLPLGAVAFGCLLVRRLLRQQQQLQAERAQIVASVTDAIDLFGVMLRAGHAVGSCVGQASDWLDGAVGASFGWCADQAGQGKRLADVLELLPDRLKPHDAPLRPLVAALVANERHGAPIVTSLTQLGADTRADQRRQAEAVARRLPVSLLFPLVVCVLPAFLLLTVVPVLSESLSTVDLFASPE